MYPPFPSFQKGSLGASWDLMQAREAGLGLVRWFFQKGAHGSPGAVRGPA